MRNHTKDSSGQLRMKHSARKRSAWNRGKLTRPRTEWVKMKDQLMNMLQKEEGKDEGLENREEQLGTTEDRNRRLRKQEAYQENIWRGGDV